MKYAEFDLSNLPIIHVKINPVDVSLIEYKQDVLAVQTRLLHDYSDAVWVFNSKHTKLLSSEHRIAAGNWLKENLPLLKEKVRMVFFIECSFWTEMMLKSIFLVAKLPVPMKVVKDISSVTQFLQNNPVNSLSPAPHNT